MNRHDSIAHIAEDGRIHSLKERCVVVDVETTGLSPHRGDRIIEIGAVAVERGRIIDEFQTMVNAGKSISTAARQVHGITDEMLIGQPKPEEVFPRIGAFIGDRILVAHNASFDVGFLRYEFSRLGFGFSNRYVCTLEMSRARYPRLRDHKLQTVYRHLFREMDSAVQQHRALNDARMVARVLVELMKR